MERKINFIIIGAQKAGTTFLHNILNTSNDIYIPLEKELPFFLEDNIDDESYKKFFLKYFNKSKPNQIIGTSTPQYMMYPNSFSNIKERLPDVKLIVVLREPIKRLISHYDMVYRFGKENRSINLVIEDQIKNIEYYRTTPFKDATGKYISSGEYGRIINELYKTFKKSQIHILLFKDLIAYPEKELKKIFNFLNIDTQVKILNKIGNMYGGKRKIINIDLQKFFSSFKKLSLEKLVPESFIKTIKIFINFIDNINVDTNSKSKIDDINPKLLILLKNHYIKDLELLKKISDIDLSAQ